MKFTKTINLNIVFILAMIVFIVSSYLYIRYSWDLSLAEKSEEVMLHAQTASIGLDGEMIKLLRAVPEDVGTMPYESIKKRLMKLSEVDQEIVFAYLLLKREDKIYFMADSEPIDSEDYSPPGQYYEEADEQVYNSFLVQLPFISEAATDRWGTWKSALIPLRDDQGKIFAVFGFDYSASDWDNQARVETEKKALNAFWVFLIIAFFYIILRSLIRLGEKDEKLEESEGRYKNLIKQSRTFIWEVDNNLTYTYVSDNVKEIIGYTPAELVGKKTVFDLHPREGLEEFKANVWDTINKKKAIQNLENQLVNKRGEIIWVLSSGISKLDKKGNLIAFRGSDMDITIRKKREEDLDKFNNFMVGRELKMIELKEKLKKKL